MPVDEEIFRPVRMVFTTRAGGPSASPDQSYNLGDDVGDDPEDVAPNRQRLVTVTGVDDIVWLEQLHTNTVAVDDNDAPAPVEATDAIVTTTPRLGLGVLVADCVPVLLADSKAKVVAAAHAGRMGARNGISANTIDAMVELGATPANIQVLLGPAASGRNYEVPEDMANDVEAHLPGSKTRTAKGTWGVDVRAGLIRQLMSKGVTAIEADPRCTIEDKDFFSYRREGKTGRQAALIWLEEEK